MAGWRASKVSRAAAATNKRPYDRRSNASDARSSLLLLLLPAQQRQISGRTGWMISEKGVLNTSNCFVNYSESQIPPGWCVPCQCHGTLPRCIRQHPLSFMHPEPQLLPAHFLKTCGQMTLMSLRWSACCECGNMCAYIPYLYSPLHFLSPPPYHIQPYKSSRAPSKRVGGFSKCFIHVPALSEEEHILHPLNHFSYPRIATHRLGVPLKLSPYIIHLMYIHPLSWTPM